MNILSKLLHGVEHLIGSWLNNGHVKAALEAAATLAVKLEPVVEEIGALVPNRTVKEIVAAYEKYGYPVIEDYLDDPLLARNALFNLAGMEARKLEPEIPQNIIDTAVQMAVTASHANALSKLPPQIPAPVNDPPADPAGGKGVGV